MQMQNTRNSTTHTGYLKMTAKSVLWLTF